MNRRPRTWLLTLVGFIFISGIGLYIFRIPLLTAILNHQLDKQGIPAHSLSVASVSFNHLLLRNLAVGTDRELQVDHILITWRLPDLFAGKLPSVEISGLQVALDLSSGQPPLGSLQPLIPSTAENSGPLRLPAISLLNANIHLRSELGNFVIALAGNVDQDQTGVQAAQFGADITGPPGRAKSRLMATLGAQGDLQGKIIVSEGMLSLPAVHIAGLAGDVTFALMAMRPQHINAQLMLSDILLTRNESVEQAPTPVFEQAKLDLKIDESNAQLTGELLANEDTLVAQWDAAVRDYLDAPDFDLTFYADGAASHFPWSLVGLAQPSQGSVAFEIIARGQIPTFQELRNQDLTNLTWLHHSTLTGQAHLELQGLNYPQKASNVTGKLGLNIALDEGSGKIILADDSELGASRLYPDWLASLGLPIEAANYFSDGGQLRMTGPNNQPAQINLTRQTDSTTLIITTLAILSTDKTQAHLSALTEMSLNDQNRLTAFTMSDFTLQTTGIRYADTVIDRIVLTGGIHGSPDTWAGTLDLLAEGSQLAAGPLVIRQLSVALPMQISLDHDTWRMGLQKPGRISLGAIAPINDVSFQGPLSLSISQTDIELASRSQGLAFSHRLVATPTALSLRLQQQETQAIDAHIHPGKITLSGKREAGGQYQGQGSMHDMRIALPQADIHLENIATTLHLGTTETGKIADFTIGRLYHQASAPFFAPISLAGHVMSKSSHGKPRVYSMSATGGVPDRHYLRLTGEQVFDSGEGALKIEITPLDFAPGGLQPEMLLPSLAQLKDMRGLVSASAQFKWSKEGMHSSALVDLDDVSFAYQATKVTDLNATLNLNDLMSPSSSPAQTLTIRRIDPGFPMESLVASYQIKNSPPRVILDKAQLFTIGGIISLVPTTIDLTSTRNDFVILVDNIDLAVLFDLLQVEGLTGDGRLTGSIPITLEGNQVAIHNSHFAAETSGILHFQSPKAPQMLANAGKEMDLLLKALQNFYYTELSLELNKSAAHDLVATLSLLGNNPDVKAGQMFRLNINLESNIGKILETISQGHTLSNEVMSDLFRLR